MVLDLASNGGENVGVAESDSLGVTSRAGGQHEDGGVSGGDAAGGEDLGLGLSTGLLDLDVGQGQRLEVLSDGLDLSNGLLVGNQGGTLEDVVDVLEEESAARLLRVERGQGAEANTSCERTSVKESDRSSEALTQCASPEDLNMALLVRETSNNDVLVGLKTGCDELLRGLHRVTVEVRIGKLLLYGSLSIQEADMGNTSFLSPGVEKFGKSGGLEGGAHVVCL